VIFIKFRCAGKSGKVVWVLSRENMPFCASSRPLEGEVAEVLSRELCGARYVLAALWWLKAWEKFTTEASNKHQLI
jgi:hypothetical protein